MTDNPDLADLLARIAARATVEPVPKQPRRIPKPIYVLTVDEDQIDEHAIILIIRTSKDGVVRGTVSLPQWYELPEMWDGPHEVADAIRLADDYADAYGFAGIAIDIESSQLWDPAWGELDKGGEF